MTNYIYIYICVCVCVYIGVCECVCDTKIEIDRCIDNKIDMTVRAKTLAS